MLQKDFIKNHLLAQNDKKTIKLLYSIFRVNPVGTKNTSRIRNEFGGIRNEFGTNSVRIQNRSKIEFVHYSSRIR